MSTVICYDRNCEYCTKHLKNGKFEGGHWTDLNYGNARVPVYHCEDLVPTEFGGTMTKVVDTDDVNKPEHYNLKRPANDAFDVMTQLGMLENYPLATAFKYLWRCNNKNSYLKDLKKCQWFINKAIEIYEAKHGTEKSKEDTRSSPDNK